MYTVLCLIILSVNSDNLTDLRVLQKQSEAILKSLVWGVYRWPISIHFFTYEIQMSIILRKLKTLIKTIIIYDQILYITSSCSSWASKYIWIKVAIHCMKWNIFKSQNDIKQSVLISNLWYHCLIEKFLWYHWNQT